MKRDFFGTLAEPVQGALLIVVGLILFLHTLGVLHKFLGIILILISIYLMIIGFIKAGGIKTFKKLTKKTEKKE